MAYFFVFFLGNDSWTWTPNKGWFNRLRPSTSNPCLLNIYIKTMCTPVHWRLRRTSQLCGWMLCQTNAWWFRWIRFTLVQWKIINVDSYDVQRCFLFWIQTRLELIQNVSRAIVKEMWSITWQCCQFLVANPIRWRSHLMQWYLYHVQWSMLCLALFDEIHHALIPSHKCRLE